MEIAFNASDGPTLGVEVELEVVDASTRELASVATELLEELSGGTGEHPKAKHELFECTVEIITGICTTVGEARIDLQGTLAALDALTQPRDLALMCSGTHPFSSWRDQKISPNPRYARLIEEMAWMAERMQIFGVHFHVGVRSAEKAVAIANALTFYIPHFLAASASSPYWNGRDTGLASCRSKVFEGLPTAGLPEPIDSWDDFEAFMETLVAAEAISSIREVWWDIRPHPDFGTVELRMCDGLPTMDEVAALAALAQSLVDWLDALMDRGYRLPVAREWIVRQNKWRAARYGLDADLIIDSHGARRPLREAISDLIEELTPTARRLGCAEDLGSLRHTLAAGSSTDRQRRVVAEGGTLVDVVDLLVKEMATNRVG
ncbi:MAG: glutamate---cysteine ligase / carboxylate-amine ligase [Acidimicrobiaceae bacterium]